MNIKREEDQISKAAMTPGRRSFLGVVIGLIGAAIAAVLGVTIGRYTIGRSLKFEDQSSWTDAGLLEDLPDGNWVKRNVIVSQDAGWGKFNSQRPIWVKKAGQDFTVFSATCPHLGCTINEAASGFICPCHGSAWNLDGQKLGGPAPRGMDSLESRVDGDTLKVKYEYFKQGGAEKVIAG
jgi:Rieske Fe-S protein